MVPCENSVVRTRPSTPFAVWIAMGFPPQLRACVSPWWTRACRVLHYGTAGQACILLPRGRGALAGGRGGTLSGAGLLGRPDPRRGLRSLGGPPCRADRRGGRDAPR